MAGGSITVHSRELCSALLGTSVDGAGRGEEEEEETKSGYPERGGRVSPVRAPSRGSTAMHIEDWLSRKARRAVVVSATVCIPYMDILLMVYCMQALPDDAIPERECIPESRLMQGKPVVIYWKRGKPSRCSFLLRELH